jgi:hypothetical protein
MTLKGEYGSYATCPLCDWEDDPVQLANPTSEGGANKKSLLQAQQSSVEKYPVHVQLAGGFRRTTSWRPLLPSEIEAFNLKKDAKHWHTTAALTESEAYWQLAQVAKPLAGATHGYKYRLAYVVHEVCVLRYDNEVGKGDHRHYGNKESAYNFTTPDQLIADFQRDIARWNNENRNP